MDALAGATVLADPEPYVGRLAAASPCADTANDPASTSGGSRGVPLFASAPVPPSNDAAVTVEVVEDLAVFAGGAVWCLDWAPTTRGAAETTRLVAVEARAKDDVAHALGDVGRARGPGLVQVMALRMPDGVSENGSSATARVVLGLAHDAEHAFDLKWRPSAEGADENAASAPAETASAGARGARADAASVAGNLAVALGNGRVEVWRVPTPERVRTSVKNAKPGSNPGPPVIACASAFVGVAPRDAGVPLCVDWASARPRNRIVAGTSAGAIVLWTIPEEDTATATNTKAPAPVLPVMRLASTGCPQRSVRFAPPAFFSAPSSASSREEREKHPDSSFLMLAGGHGMHAPAVFDSRDPFFPSAGSRASSFGGHAALTRVAFAPNGVFLSASDDGAVAAHDFFLDARASRPRGDTAERVAKRTLAHDAAFPENAVRTHEGTTRGEDRREKRKKTKRATEPSRTSASDDARRVIRPSLALDPGAAWSVDAKPAFSFRSAAAREDVGCVLVLAGFGRAGARLAFLSLGNGLRKVNASRGKDELREAGVPVDLAFVGATATFSEASPPTDSDDSARLSDDAPLSSPETETDGVVVDTSVAALMRRAAATARARADAVRVAAPARRGAGGFGFCSDVSSGTPHARVSYAPVRCVRWLDPETPVSASPDRAWCAWGDDAGFVRFQRLGGDAVAATARAVSEMERRN